jgi:ABC-2 type transport system permease protein
MSTVVHGVSNGLQRGAIEARHKITNFGEIWGEIWPWVLGVVVMYFLRGNTFGDTGVSVGLLAAPGILGMAVLYTGMMGLSLELVTDKSDGTLLRMKAIPNGIVGYLTGKFVGRTMMTAVSLLLVSIPAAFLIDGLRLGDASAWTRLGVFYLLGLLAVLPLGAIIGSLFGSLQGLGLLT